jgi:hypothetical protein
MQVRKRQTLTGNPDTGDFKATPGTEILMLLESDAEMTPADSAPFKRTSKKT